MQLPPLLNPQAAWSGGARALWMVVLVVCSIAFTLGFACALPLAAFGALAAVTLSWRSGALLLGAVWLTNQVIGFGWLHYPPTPATFAWGAILGAIAVLCVAGPVLVVRRLPEGAGAVLTLVASFAVAFVIYEGGLFVVSATIMGGVAAYAPAIVARVAEINLAAFGALLALWSAAGALVGRGAELPRIVPAG